MASLGEQMTRKRDLGGMSLSFVMELKADLLLSRPSSKKVEAHFVPALNIPAQDGGVYVPVLELSRGTRIRVGALGSIWFPKGAYAYVGSARNGLRHRIKHYLKNSERLHWHIDYLRQFAVPRFVIYVVTTDRIECRLASSLMKRFSAFRSFGCSNCGCMSHLFYHETADLILKVGIEAVASMVDRSKTGISLIPE